MNKENADCLDACCGSRMMWHDKQNPRVIGLDKREGTYELCDGRTIRVQPDILGDFRALPFEDGRFTSVLFDPPHLYRVGEKSWTFAKYGKLEKATWKEDIRRGLAECFRVLAPGGTLIAKWSDVQLSKAEFISLAPVPPTWVTGTHKGKGCATYIIIFHK